MHYLNKHWYLVIITLLTVGLAVLVILTSGKLSQTKQVAPTVPQQEPQAASAACTVSFTVVVSADTPTTTLEPMMCISLVAYKDGNALSASDLSALQPGDTITITFIPGGPITKVRFRVNSSSDADWHESTTKNANGQFVWDYTLTNTTSFFVEGQYFDGSVWH